MSVRPVAATLARRAPETGTLDEMTELGLRRSHDERRLYTLEGVGTIRFEGVASRTATARSQRESWRIARRGLLRQRVEATADRV